VRLRRWLRVRRSRHRLCRASARARFVATARDSSPARDSSESPARDSSESPAEWGILLCPVPCGGRWVRNGWALYFAECQVMGHSAKNFKNSLPSAKRWGTRQRLTASDRRHAGYLCRRPKFAEFPALGKGKNLPTVHLCRGHFFAWHSAKAALPRAFLCRVSLGLALGKYFLCRVPEEMRSANNFAFGKAAVSCSESQLSMPQFRLLTEISKLKLTREDY
jgi:hypothetical protein